MPQRLRQIFAACTLLAGTLVSAQAQQPLSLDQLLSQIEVNTERYSATVPSFICNEHVLSQEVHEGKIKRETTVDAVFSVTRSTAKANTLEESREIKLIDGKPAASKKMTMPLSFSGGFSGALYKFLSSDHRSCFEYAADASTQPPKGTAAFTFVTKPTAAKDTSCASIQPGTTGKFTVDTTSMQVTHIERTVQKSRRQGSDCTRHGSCRLCPRCSQRQVLLAPHYHHCLHHRDFEDKQRSFRCSLQRLSSLRGDRHHPPSR